MLCLCCESKKKIIDRGWCCGRSKRELGGYLFMVRLGQNSKWEIERNRAMWGCRDKWQEARGSFRGLCLLKDMKGANPLLVYSLLLPFQTTPWSLFLSLDLDFFTFSLILYQPFTRIQYNIKFFITKKQFFYTFKLFSQFLLVCSVGLNCHLVDIVLDKREPHVSS